MGSVTSWELKLLEVLSFLVWCLSQRSRHMALNISTCALVGWYIDRLVRVIAPAACPSRMNMDSSLPRTLESYMLLTLCSGISVPCLLIYSLVVCLMVTTHRLDCLNVGPPF
jgi:hypothetical protein